MREEGWRGIICSYLPSFYIPPPMYCCEKETAERGNESEGVDNVPIFNTAEVARTTASDQKTSKIVGSKQQVLNVSCCPSCSGVLFPGVNCKSYRGEKSCPSLFEVSEMSFSLK